VGLYIHCDAGCGVSVPATLATSSSHVMVAPNWRHIEWTEEDGEPEPELPDPMMLGAVGITQALRNLDNPEAQQFAESIAAAGRAATLAGQAARARNVRLAFKEATVCPECFLAGKQPKTFQIKGYTTVVRNVRGREGTPASSSALTREEIAAMMKDDLDDLLGVADDADEP
jgi:hypothetical protein